jgi:hypothetical protein
MQRAMRNEVGMCDGLPKKLGCGLEVDISYCTVRVTVVECCRVTPPAPVAVPMTLTV